MVAFLFALGAGEEARTPVGAAPRLQRLNFSPILFA
jgi:hypothetical protein